MPENTENHDLIVTAQEAVEPHQLTPGRWLVRDSGGQARVIDLADEIEADRPNPSRKQGDASISDVPSFAGYLAKHGLPETELWGNRDKSTITAVINADGAAADDGGVSLDGNGTAGWGDNTATLTLLHSADWKNWTGHDGQLLTKDQFAEFVEDHLPNFADGAAFLELARSFRATMNVEFGNAEHAGGRTTVNYTKTTEAKAGQKGAVAFPDTITIGVYVYDGGKAYKLDARLRYKVTDGDLRIGFKLQRPKDVLQAAFDEVVTEVETATGRTVWRT